MRAAQEGGDSEHHDADMDELIARIRAGAKVGLNAVHREQLADILGPEEKEEEEEEEEGSASEDGDGDGYGSATDSDSDADFEDFAPHGFDASDETQAFQGISNLHPPVHCGSLKCLPFKTIADTLNGPCNCADFGLPCCQALLPPWRSDEQPVNMDAFGGAAIAELDFVAFRTRAIRTRDNPRRLGNNSLRKALYQKVFSKLTFPGDRLQQGERRPLPNCVVAMVRQIYPSQSGNYMGFLAN